MTRITADNTLREKLHNFAHSIEICDESGRVIAQVTPIYDPNEYGPLEPQVSEEELLRRANSDEKRYTTAEVLKHLESL